MKLFLSALVLVFSPVANAESTYCYRFEMPESAEMRVFPASVKQTWCYKTLSSPIGSKLIYNVDSPSVRPELSAIVDADGVVTHGSLTKGRVTTHKVLAGDINPLPVPLREPTNLLPLSLEEASADAEVVTKGIYDVLETLQAARAELPVFSISEGVVTAAVPVQNLPWRGFWWSYKGNLLAGDYSSPLAKYDRYVKARTGITPRVQSWENTYHRFKGTAWEGHCNGWAASAVLRAEPNVNRFHQQTGIVFSVGDQKGILAEEDYCATVAFYGKRNYGKANNDPSDIYPAEFHKVLTYYIGQLGKVVAMDYHASRTVDNHLVSGYTMSIVKKSASTYSVTADLTVHRYDASPSKPPGIAPAYIRTYKYNLKVDAAGNPLSGTWLTANPDFLWVPLSPLDCSSNNPRMSQSFTSEIMRLPPQ